MMLASTLYMDGTPSTGQYDPVWWLCVLDHCTVWQYFWLSVNFLFGASQSLSKLLRTCCRFVILEIVALFALAVVH